MSQQHRHQEPRPRLGGIYLTDALTFLSYAQLHTCRGVSTRLHNAILDGKRAGKLPVRKHCTTISLEMVS